MNVEAVRKQQRRVLLKTGLDVVVELGLRHVGHKEGNEVGAIHGCDRVLHIEAVLFGARGAVPARPQTDDYVVPGIAQIHRMCASLTAIAEYRDTCSFERIRLYVVLVRRAPLIPSSNAICQWYQFKKKPRSLSGAGLRSFVVVS